MVDDVDITDSYVQQYRREDVPLDKYLDIMGTEQERGFFNPKMWHTPVTHPHVEGAREDVKQLAKQYAAGDRDTVNFVKDFERNDAIGNQLLAKQKEFGNTPEIMKEIDANISNYKKYINSGKELDKSVAYRLFIEMAGNRMKQRLNDEDYPVSEKEAEELNTQANFDYSSEDTVPDWNRLSKILGYPKK